MPNVPFITGLELKPNKIREDGVVTFTDGTNEVTPNQFQCEAYGYVYDIQARVCRAYTYFPEIETRNKKSDNNTQGDENEIVSGAKNTYIMGQKNSVGNRSRNNIVVGSRNIINPEISDSTLFGTGGVGLFNGAMVFGGSNAEERAGTRQLITLLYGGDTTNNTTSNIYPSANQVESNFQPQVNRMYYFQSETLATRTGGSAGGTVGDFKAWVERGVVKCNSSGTLSISRQRTSPVSSGTTTGWQAVNSVSGSDFLQTVTGATNMNIRWVSNIRIMQVFTNVSIP
tara:strand:+ start:478 stop:1332 length:855 start_codon:yes stop_codon:yes gene_type:complete